MKFVKFLFVLTLIFFSFACTSTNIIGKSSKNSKQFQTIVESSVNQEVELHSIGGSKIQVSGIKVSRMIATENAEDILKEKIQKYSCSILENFSKKADIYEKKLSNKIMDNLSEYVAKKVMENSQIKKEWEYDTGEIFVLITVKKEDIVKITKNIFVEHIDKVIYDLQQVQKDAFNYTEGTTKDLNNNLSGLESEKIDDAKIDFDV